MISKNYFPLIKQMMEQYFLLLNGKRPMKANLDMGGFELKNWAQVLASAQLGSGTPTGSNYLCGDRTWKTLPTTESVVRLTGDQSNSSESLADAMATSLPANFEFYFEYVIIYTSALTTNGIWLTIKSPSVDDTFAFICVYGLVTNVAKVSNFNTSDAGEANTSSLAGLNYAHIFGWIKPAHTGYLILRFASENTAQEVTIKAGTILKLRRLT